eukprot:4638066-Prymnesium_polylepis.2
MSAIPLVAGGGNSLESLMQRQSISGGDGRFAGYSDCGGDCGRCGGGSYSGRDRGGGSYGG